MSGLSHSIKAYLNYRSKAVGPYKIHSPFVFDLVNTIFKADQHYYSFPAIELVRKKMLLDHSVINILDLGAGAKNANVGKTQRKISQIARNSLKKEKYAQLLFRLANKFECNALLELGTSLGITTSYLAKARKKSRVYTIEGAPEIAQIAQTNFDRLKLKNIDLSVGNFDNVLDNILQKEEKFDLVFIDGNHRKKATLNYFQQLLTKTNENAIFVFDDIHWSKDMEEAWDEIKSNSSVTLTIDLFEMGLVFFKPGKRKEHFVIRY